MTCHLPVDSLESLCYETPFLSLLPGRPSGLLLNLFATSPSLTRHLLQVFPLSTDTDDISTLISIVTNVIMMLEEVPPVVYELIENPDRVVEDARSSLKMCKLMEKVGMIQEKIGMEVVEGSVVREVLRRIQERWVGNKRVWEKAVEIEEKWYREAVKEEEEEVY